MDFVKDCGENISVMMTNIQKHGHWFKTTDRCCFNCKHLMWMIGVGQGLRCGYTEDRMMIPSISYVCDDFKGIGSTEWSCKCSRCKGKI